MLLGRTKPEQSLEQTFLEARRDPNSIGNMALAKGWITEEDLREALTVQRERFKLGEILVELGKLSAEQRDELLIEQRLARGEKVTSTELHKFERSKLHNRVKTLKTRFQEVGAEARELAVSVAAVVAKG